MTGCWNVSTELCVAWHGPLGNMHTHIVVWVAGVSTANRIRSSLGRHSNVSALQHLGAVSMNSCNPIPPTTIKITAPWLKMPHYTCTYLQPHPCHVLRPVWLTFAFGAFQKKIKKFWKKSICLLSLHYLTILYEWQQKCTVDGRFEYSSLHGRS
jgi:hypothetical protein